MQLSQQSNSMHTSKSNLKWIGIIGVVICGCTGFGIVFYLVYTYKSDESSNTTPESSTENAKTTSDNLNSDSLAEFTQNVSPGSDQTDKTKTLQVVLEENENDGKNSSKDGNFTHENQNTGSLPTTVENGTPVFNSSKVCSCRNFLVLTADEKGILLNNFLRYLFSKKTHDILLKSIPDQNPVTDTDKWHPDLFNAVKPLVNLIAFIFDKVMKADFNDLLFTTVDEKFNYTTVFEDQSDSECNFYEFINVNGQPKDLLKNLKQWNGFLKTAFLFVNFSKNEIAVLKKFLSIEDNIVKQFKSVYLSIVPYLFDIMVFIMQVTVNKKETYYYSENITMLKNLWIITKLFGAKYSCLSLLYKTACFDLRLFEKILSGSDLDEFEFNLPKVDDIIEKAKTHINGIKGLTPPEFNILAKSFLETFFYETDSIGKKTYLPKEKLLPLVGLVEFCSFYLDLIFSGHVRMVVNNGVEEFFITNLDENDRFVIAGDVLNAKCGYRSFNRSFDQWYKIYGSKTPNKESFVELFSVMFLLKTEINVMFPNVVESYSGGFKNNTVDLNSFKKLFATEVDKFSCVRNLIKDNFISLVIKLVNSLIDSYKFVNENKKNKGKEKVDFDKFVTSFFIMSEKNTSKYAICLTRILTVCMHAGIKFDNEFLDKLKTDEILPDNCKNNNEIKKVIDKLNQLASLKVN